MIQEPQQPEIIEIPLANSMSTTVNSTCQNKLLNTKIPNSNNNNKSQRTLLNIPQPQNSKPRIFLLTRPAKTRLVRLETQTVQPQSQRNLNSSLLHHPQKVETTTPVTVTSQNHSKIIRIPFLPRSQVQTFSVKSNTSQVLKKDLKIVPYQVHQYSDHKVIRDPITQVNTKSQLSPTTQEEVSNNQLQTQETSVKNTLAKSTVKYLNLSENINQTIQTQVKAQAQSETEIQKPLTLASMAGIELTGADMSLSQADMSGAMPPTATVEEINVPVFIDEYLQQATAASTTSVNNNFNINNNNNNNNTSQYISNNHSNEKGNEVNNFLDTFEFDINLLTEHSSDDKDTALEVPQQQQQVPSSYHQQQQLTEVDDNKNSKQHHLELQMMLEEIFFNNNNNTSNNDNNNSTTSIHNNNNNNNVTTMASNDEIEELFKCTNGNFLDESSPFDDIDGTDLMDNEDAINLNNIDNNFTLSECLNNSQHNDIMFTSGCSQSQSSSQKLLANEIANAEPHINVSVEPSTPVALNPDMESWNIYPSVSNDENILTDCSQTKSLLNNLKRNSSQTMVQDIPEKRLKLDLTTKQCRMQQQPEISTPNIIDIIGQLDHENMPPLNLSFESIIDELKSSSPRCESIKTENVDETTNDYSPPNTPFSYNSFSNQSNFVNTAPNSPASSIATNTNASITTKRGRGRPPKTHSDIPDPAEIQNLSESEKKKLLERAKNNEASRKSRLKHKERDSALEREEINLTHRNAELAIELERYKKMEKKLKAALRRQLFN